MSRRLTKIISIFICLLLIFQQSGFTQIAGELDLSSHFFALRNTFIQDRFRPLHLRYLSYDPSANNFNLLLDKGDFVRGLSPQPANPKEGKGTVPEDKLQQETKTLLNYFFIGISLPNEAFWVNLRPDAEDNIIDSELAETDVGKILLEADLQLKKDTANFTSPQTPEGKDYWDKLYKKAEELYGNENITIPTLTRPWIVPDEIIIRESSDNAYIYKATLKVMLEQDYLKDSSTYNFKDQRSKALNEYSSQLIRETIIPKLTKEINSSKRYAPLRQVYYSLILAQWFKQQFYGKSGVYSYLIDRHNLNGLTSKTSWSKTTYFNAYKTSFQQGEYNIKEPRSTLYGQSIRSYMSGGIQLGSQEAVRQIIRSARPLGNNSLLFFKNNYIAQGLVKASSAIDAPYHIEAIDINNMAQGATNLKQQPSSSSLQADTPVGSPVAQKQPAVAGPEQQPEKIKNIYGLISAFRKALFQRNERARFYGTRKQLIKMGFRPAVYEQALEYALGSKDAKMALRAISSLEQKFSTGEGNQSVETLKIIAVLAEPQIAQYAVSSLAVALTIASTARAAVLELREIARCALIEPQIAQYAISSLASALVTTVDFDLSEDIAYELFHLAQERRKAVRDEALSSLKLALSTPGLNPKIYERIAKLFESLIRYAKKDTAQEVVSFLESTRNLKALELDPAAFKAMGYTLANTGWQRRGLIRRTSIFPLEQEDLRKKLAVIIHPIEDDNGAFKDIENKGKQLESRGYQVIIARVGGIDALLTALKAATARRRASVIMIGGHGSRTSIQLGFGEPDSKLTIRDKQLKEKLSAAVGTLEENGIIILDSCSTGKGGRLFSNIAQLFADTFPQGFVFTSPYPVVAEKGIRLIFNKENEVTAVEFLHAYWPKGYYNSVAKRDINSSGNLAIAEKVRNSEDSQNGAAGSPAAQTSTASPAAQESSASSPVQGTALVNLPSPQIQVITALQPDLNVSLSNEKTQFTIYKDEENKSGRLRIRQKDVMKENIAENEFDARRIFPLLSVGDKTLEKELRKDIARIIRGSNTDHDKFYMNYSPEIWSRERYKKMIEDFRSKGINLESYEGLEADIIKAFREAIWYYSDAFGNVFGEEMGVLRYYQTSNRFLRLGHPIAVRLQKLLDKMAERGFPVARILVAIDGEDSLAFSIGQTVVINLALIMRLDTIDEVAAVLAHEQGHVEFNLARERGQKGYGEHSFIEDISAGRLQEHGADLVTTTKLAKLGLYSLALSDVLRKIAGGSSQQDIVHGSISNRIVSVMGYHRFHDVEAGRSQAGQNMDIPDNWLLSTVTPSIKERIFNKKYGADFQAAVGESSYKLIEDAMNEFVRKLSYLEPKDNDYGEIAEKLLYVMNFCIDRIGIESAKENWPRGKKEAVVLSLLMNRGRSISWVKIYNKDVVSMQSPSVQEQIIGILRQPALFLLQAPDGVKTLEELRGSKHMGQIIDKESQSYSVDFLAALLVSDEWVTNQVIGNAYNINQKSYLTIFNTYLSRLVGLKQEHQRKKWLSDWIAKVIGGYVENFWKNHESSKENLLMLTEHLKEANAEYAKLLGLESVKDLQSLYDSYFLVSGWNKKLYDLIVNKVNISHTELINIIFGIQDDVLRECINVLKSKDEQLFFSFLNLYPMVFLEYLNSMDSREADPELKTLFQGDPKLSEWLFSILSKQWATNTLKLPPDYRNDDFDKRWPNDEEKLLGYLEFTNYFRDDESKQKYKRFMFGLEAVKLLPVPDRERRFSMIKTYVNSGRAKLFLNGLPLRNMSYVIQDLEGIFKQNVGQEYTASLLDKRYEDKKLNFAVYWLLRDRLLSHIKPTVSLELAEKIYWFIGRYSNTVYGSTNLGGAIAGNSEAHSLWLLPVNKAYLNYLGERRDLAVSFASPEISIRYYFALRAILPSGKAKERILVAFAKRLIEQLPDEHVVAFLTELSEKGDINREIYGHFVKKRVNTKEKFLYFKKYRDKYLQRLASVGSVKLLALMVGDNLVDVLLKNDLATEVFEAMLGSGKSDEELQKLLVTPWFFAMAAYGEGRQFKIEYEGGSVEVTGAGRGNFIPFSELMDLLYDSPAPVKFMIMNKLLLSPKGVLQTQAGLKQFARIICKYLPEDGQLSDLLRSVLESSVSVIDAERLFLSLANSLLTIFLQKPEGGSNALMAEALSEALAANIDRLNTWDVFQSFAADKLKKAKKDELGRFLRKYEKRIDHTEIVKRIEPLIESLGEKLEEELSIAAESKPSVSGEIAKHGTLEAIDVVLETCQSMGPVGVRFLQVLGQYLPLSPEYQDRFRDVYDAAEGQDKFTAWDTILKVGKLDQEVAKFIEEDLVSIDETLGGGSIVTVFSTTVRNRDLDGNLTEGTHKEVLKIRNPNAEAFVNEVSEKAIKVVEHLDITASRADRKNYRIAKQLLKDIREWVIQDIRDTSFMELDSKYQRAHEDYIASNGMKVRVPPALRPNNKDIKREAHVEGVTLNKLLKLKLSGKSLEQLIEEEPDPEARRLLINLKRNTPFEEGATILNKTFREATRALVEDFSRHLVQPIFTREDGQDVYLLHSDIHPGNAILSPDAKTDYPIDRNFYLQLDKTDVEFIRKICTLSPDQEYELLNTIVGYFINLAENSNSLSRFSPLYKLRQKFMTIRIGVAIKLSGEKDSLANMVKILQVLESYNFIIPLKIRIMLKNLVSIRGMLKEAGAGEFSDYVLDAEQKYNNTAILSATEIKEAKNTAGSPAKSASSPAQKGILVEKDGRFFLNVGLLQSFLRQAVDKDRRNQLIIVGSAKYLADATGLAPLDSITDIDIIVPTQVKLEEYVKKLNDNGFRGDSLGSMRIADRQLDFQVIGYFMSDDGASAEQSYRLETELTAVMNAAWGSEAVYYKKWIKMYLSLEYYWGIPERYKKNHGAFLDCRDDDQRMKRLFEEIRAGDLQYLKKDIDRLDSEEKIKRVKKRIFGEPFSNPEEIGKALAVDSLAEGETASSPAKEEVGGIDMRTLPKYTKVEKVAAGSPLVKQGQSPSGTVPVSDKEWQEIERMANSGIAPSSERIREYLLSLQDPSTQVDKVLACIADILRQEEEKACGTESSLKEILVLLESGKPVNELRLALINIQVLAKEPQLITQ